MALPELTPTFPHHSHVSVAESILQSLLTTEYKVELNAKTRMFSLLSTKSPSILGQQQFTVNEWNVFLTLITSYPHYAPYEILIANLTLLSPSVCRERLQAAQESGPKVLKQELKPIYRSLANVRVKLNKVYPHLKISLIRGLGYALTTSSR